MQGFNSFQEFLDSKQYSEEGVLKYEKIFGEGFISTGGIESTKVGFSTRIRLVLKFRFSASIRLVLKLSFCTRIFFVLEFTFVLKSASEVNLNLTVKCALVLKCLSKV